MEGAQQQRAAVVYNPVKVDRETLEDAVERVQLEAGWRPSIWLETTPEEAGDGLARQAVERGATVVLAAGGDGTVRSVAEGLRGSRVPLALLPSGTGNVLARNLKLKLTDLDRAVDIAFNGDTEQVDVGLITIQRPNGESDEHVFLVMAGLGLDAEIMAATDSKVKKAVGWLAYFGAGVRTLAKSKPFLTRLQTSTHAPFRIKAHTVVIGNCGVLPGNLILLPQAKIDDGLLDVIGLAPRGFFDWIKIWQRVVIEHPIAQSAMGKKLVEANGRSRLKTLTYLQGPDVEIHVAEPQHCQLDGDPLGLAIGLESWVLPGELHVKVPTGRRSDGPDRAR